MFVCMYVCTIVRASGLKRINKEPEFEYVKLDKGSPLLTGIDFNSNTDK